MTADVTVAPTLPGTSISISVVMSTYNDAAYLAESIDSVLGQDFEDFEFVIVNDGCPDPATEHILAKYAQRDSRVRIIHKKNEGLTKALIVGCESARGEYIARIDVGDIMTPDRLRRQAVVMDKHPDAVLASCWTEYCGPNWEYLYIKTSETSDTPRNAAYRVDDAISPRQPADITGGPTCHPSVLFRKAAYVSAGGYRPQFYYGQDWDLWYRLAQQGKFACVEAILYKCRIFPAGVSMSNIEKQQRIHECSRGAFQARQRGEDEGPWLERAAAIRPGGCGKPQQKCSAAGYYFVGEALRRNGDAACRSYFLNALRSAPFTPRNYVRLLQSLVLHR
jgi:GT2 family glycosyltransferase